MNYNMSAQLDSDDDQESKQNLQINAPNSNNDSRSQSEHHSHDEFNAMLMAHGFMSQQEDVRSSQAQRKPEKSKFLQQLLQLDDEEQRMLEQ